MRATASREVDTSPSIEEFDSSSARSSVSSAAAARERSARRSATSVASRPISFQRTPEAATSQAPSIPARTPVTTTAPAVSDQTVRLLGDTAGMAIETGRRTGDGATSGGRGRTGCSGSGSNTMVSQRSPICGSGFEPGGRRVGIRRTHPGGRPRPEGAGHPARRGSGRPCEGTRATRAPDRARDDANGDPSLRVVSATTHSGTT